MVFIYTHMLQNNKQEKHMENQHSVIVTVSDDKWEDPDFIPAQISKNDWVTLFGHLA